MTQENKVKTKRERRIERAKKHREQTQNVINNNIKEIHPKNENQAKVFDAYDRGQAILMAGSPGTGKTFVGLYLALQDLLTNPQCKQNKLMIIRSVVPTRDMGFLPGSAKEKMRQYETPYYYICNELFGRGDAYEVLKARNIIDFECTSFVRGNTFDNMVVLVDEFQNTTDHEINSVVTRLGQNSRLIICGDNKQDDLKNLGRKSEVTGFHKFYNIAKRMKRFTVVDFGLDDIVRSAFVKEYLIQRELYETEQERRWESENVLQETVSPIRG